MNEEFEIILLTREEFKSKVEQEFINATWTYSGSEENGLPEKYRLSRTMLVGKTFYVEDKSNG